MNNKYGIQKLLILNHFYKDPFLISNYSEFLQLYKDNNDIITKICYKNRKIIHHILYEEEENITINFEIYLLSNYFFLTLLIKDNKDIVNYLYDFSLIDIINKENIKENNILRKLINSIIILELIDNFVNGNDNIDDNQEKIEEFKSLNTEIKKNAQNILKEYGIESNLEYDLELIYTEIIKSLFYNKKIDNYNYSCNIIKQLDLENIFLTDKINDELLIFFKSNEKCLNDYIISKIADFNSEDKINSYFILIKYILKNSFYIYEIPFLFNTRKIILNTIKRNIDELLSINFNNNIFNERKNKIIKTIIDSDYYYNKYWQIILDKLNIVLNYYKNYYFESKQNDINSIQEIINNRNGNYEKYINIIDLKEAQELNNEFDIINYLHKNDDKSTEQDLGEYISNWKIIKKLIKDKKISKLRGDKKQLLLNYANENDNKKKLIEIFGQDTYDYFTSNHNIKNKIKYNDNNNDMINNDNIDNNKLKEILKYYNNFLFESKKDDIILIETSFNNDRELKNVYIKYIIDYDKAKKYNDRYEIIDYCFNINNKDNNNIKTEKDIEILYQKWMEIETMINNKKLYNDIKNKIFKYIEQTDKKVILNIFSEEIYEFLINEKHKNKIQFELKEILQYYQFYYPISKKDDINLINKFINNNNGEIEQYEKYLKDLDEAQKMNLKAPFINLLLKNEEEEISEEKIEKQKNNWIQLENMIKQGKMKNMKKDKKKLLVEIFQDKNYKDKLLTIFNKEIYDNFKNNLKKDNDNNNENKNREKEKEKEKLKEEVKENSKIITDTKTKNSSFPNGPLVPVDDDIKKIQNVQNNNLYKNTMSTKIQTVTQPKKVINENIIKDQSQTGTISEGVSLKEIENKNLIENILTKSEIKFHTNNKKNKPFILYEEINIGKNKIKSIGKFEELKNQSYKELEKDQDLYTKFIQLVNFLDEINIRLENEFELEYNLTIKLEIGLYDLINKDNLYCKYIVYLPDSNNAISFKEDNILFYKTYSPSQGFEYLISEINNEKYEHFKDIENKEKEKDKNEDNQYTTSTTNNNNISVYQPDKTGDIIDQTSINDNNQFLNIKIIGFEKKIGNHKDSNNKNNYTCEFIKELKNGEYFVSGGTDKTIKIYTKEFNEFDSDEELSKLNNGIKDWTYNICERNKSEGKSNKELEFIVCSNKELILMSYNLNKRISKIQKYELPNMTCVNCIEMKPYNFVIVGLNGGLYFPNLFQYDNQEGLDHMVITQMTLRGGIRIKDNLVALTSNKVLINGEDILIFYNSEKRNKNNPISRSIPGYSFTLTTNGLALMPKENFENKNQILICACTKYLLGQRNGILLVNPKIENKKYIHINNPFYDTGEFGVYCICPIFKALGENNTRETDFFLVGGFDNEKYEGKIRLYKLINSNNVFDTKIEYLQDIEFEINDDFEGFEGPISCITQSTYYGNILVSCYDGNVYKLTSPDLSFYENDKNK